MSKRDVRLFLKDILKSIDKIELWTKDLSFDDFAQNSLILDAVIRNLEIIGEASRNIPDDLRSQYSTIPWKRVTGFRNIAIHAYFDVDIQIVWTIATQRLLEIKPHIIQILKDLEHKEP